MQVATVAEVGAYAAMIVLLAALLGWVGSKALPRIVNRHLPEASCEDEDDKREREHRLYQMKLRIQEAQAVQANHQAEAEENRVLAEQARLRAEQTNERIQELRLAVLERSAGHKAASDGPKERG